MRQLFAISSGHIVKFKIFGFPIGPTCPCLVGILTEIKAGTETEKGEYQFEYKLNGNWQDRHFSPAYFEFGIGNFNELNAVKFNDLDKIYTGDEAYNFVKVFIPERDSYAIDSCLKSAKLTKYDEWELLKVFGLRYTPNRNIFLCEKLPKGAILYEPLE